MALLDGATEWLVARGQTEQWGTTPHSTSPRRVAQITGFAEDGAAICSECGGPVKPDVVLFGELLPPEAMAEAEALAERADLMLCVGSSLEVFPVAGLPSVTLRSGGGVAVITIGPTPFDGNAVIRMDGDVVADLEAVLEAL